MADFVFTGDVGDLPNISTNKKLLVLFLVDATKSMDGQAISQVNFAIQELVSDLKDFALNNGVDLKLAIMSFTNSIRWEMQPTDIQTCYDIQKIETRPGLTQYGVIYHELNRMLKKGSLLEEKGKQAAPVLILLTDGAPSDDYQYDLEELKKNGYFMLANRSAVIMGEAANDPAARAAVAEFASNENQILTTGMYTNIVQGIKLTTLHTLRGDGMEGNVGAGEIPNPDPGPDPGPFPLPPDPEPGPGPFPPDPGPFPPDPGPGPFPPDPNPDPGPFPPDPGPDPSPFPPAPGPGFDPFPPDSQPDPGAQPDLGPFAEPGPTPFPGADDTGRAMDSDPGPGTPSGDGTDPLPDPFQDFNNPPDHNQGSGDGQDPLPDPFADAGS